MNNNIDYSLHSVRTAAALTNSYVAGTVLGAEAQSVSAGGSITFPNQYNQLLLYISFTKASTTSLEWKVEFSPDNTNWYQESSELVSGGTATNREMEHTIVSANQSAASQLYRFAIPVTDRYIRVSAKCTGTVTSSSATITGVLGVN